MQQSFVPILRAGITQSTIRLQRRLKEKKLQEELEDMQLRSITRGDKKMQVLRRNIEVQKKIVIDAPLEGFRLGILPEEAAKGNKDVQAALSATNGCDREWLKAKKQALTAELGLSPYDTGHSAVQVACITENIMHLGKHLKRCRNDVSAFLKIRALLDDRRKMLKYLHRTNYYAYKIVVEKYELSDTPGDHHFTRMRRKNIRLG